MSDIKRVQSITCKHTGKQTDSVYCLSCGKEIIKKDSECVAEYRLRKFCNNSCAAKFNNKKHEKKVPVKKKIVKQKDAHVKIIIDHQNYCLNCGKEIPHSHKYCNFTCQNNYSYNKYIEDWKNGKEDGRKGLGVSNRIRRYLFEKYNKKCAKCGWGERNEFTQTIPLEIHHKDGNYLNNKEDNLILLCPNCHSLTETYKSHNKGNGRKGRQKYYLT